MGMYRGDETGGCGKRARLVHGGCGHAIFNRFSGPAVHRRAESMIPRLYVGRQGKLLTWQCRQQAAPIF